MNGIAELCCRRLLRRSRWGR